MEEGQWQVGMADMPRFLHYAQMEDLARSMLLLLMMRVSFKKFEVGRRLCNRLYMDVQPLGISLWPGFMA